MNRLTTIELDPNPDLSAAIEGVSIVTSEHTSLDGYSTRIIIADGRDQTNLENTTTETIIWPASYSALGGPLDKWRIAAIAKEFGTQVVWLGTPELSTDPDKQPNRPIHQLARIACGDYGQLVARKQLDALHDAIDPQSSDIYRFMAYSQGVSTTVSKLDLLSRAYWGDNTPIIQRVDIIEPVNIHDWFAPRLLRKMMTENEFEPRYSRQNVDNGLAEVLNLDPTTALSKERVVRTLRQSLALGATALGLTKSFLLQLQRAIDSSAHTTQLSDASFVLWRANRSGVSTRDAFDTMEQNIKGVPINLMEMRGITSPGRNADLHHGVVNSMGDFASLLYYLKQPVAA